MSPDNEDEGLGPVDLSLVWEENGYVVPTVQDTALDMFVGRKQVWRAGALEALEDI